MLQTLHGQLGFSFDTQENFVSETIIANILAFDRIGQETRVEQHSDLTYFINDYWTASQRQSNRLHEISYRACFKAELPQFFIERLSQPGDKVYDPFMGRGTTPLQAALMGRHPVGNDINPLSKMLLQPRLSPPPLRQIANRLEEIDWNQSFDVDEGLLVFFHPETLQQIYALRDRFLKQDELDKIDDWIRMVALNRLTGHSSGFFSVYTLPPNQAVSLERQAKINQRRNQTPPQRNVKEIILKKSKVLLSQCAGLEPQNALLGTAPAEATNYIATDSVDLVVTSPPFLDVVQYAQDNWLRCWFAGVDAETVPISMCKTVESWTDFTRGVLQELTRVVKSDGHIAYEVGEVRNGKILLEQYVAQAAQNLPLEILGVMVNQQNFTKTANCWGVKNNSKGTNSNSIVLMRKQ